MRKKREKTELNVFFLNSVDAVILKEQYRNLTMSFTVNNIP